jgi:hypothetical protein
MAMPAVEGNERLAHEPQAAAAVKAGRSTERPEVVAATYYRESRKRDTCLRPPWFDRLTMRASS